MQEPKPAIQIHHLSKEFKLPHEKLSSLKSVFVNMFRSSKGYEMQKALDNVTFDIQTGEFFGIVGRNGSGKSTLLKLLAGIYTPTKGDIVLHGQLTPFIELGVGFSPELTGRENVYLNGALLGFSRKEMQAMYQDIVDFAELQRFMDQKLKNYSSGMQVRLAFSIAIRARSDILLIDEVLAVGDAAFQQKCFNYFEELKEQKRTVVFVSHDMGAVKRFCTRAVYIRDGKLIHEGTPAEVADIYTEENIQNPETDLDDNLPQAEGSSINVKIASHKDNKLTLEFPYKTSYEKDFYIGLSVMRDGMSVAEITTPPDMKLEQTGEITYIFDTNILNAGVYQVSAVLCKLENREMLTHSKDKPQFMVKGDDITRGGSLKLPKAWKL